MRRAGWAVVAACALSWVALGCGAVNPLAPSESVSITPPVAPPDSTRWVTPGKLQPYALTWKSGTMNLWMWSNRSVSCSAGSTTNVLQYDAVYRAKLPPLLAGGTHILGTLVTWRSANSTQVLGGTFKAVVGPTGKTMTGWIVTVLASPCGAVSDSIPLNLVRYPN